MFWNYLKVAWRVFLRRKAFTFISLFGISLTLMVLVVAVSLYDHTFGAHPPEVFQERTAGIYFVQAQGPDRRMSSPGGYLLHDRYTRQLKSAELVTLHSPAMTATSYHSGKTIRSYTKRTDGQFWKVFKFNFVEGGPYTDENERNADFVAVINDSTRRKFFGNESALGKSIKIDNRAFQVVGVVEDVPLLRFTVFSDVWMPLSTASSNAYKQNLVVGMCWATILAPSPESLAEVRSEFRSMMDQVEFPDPRSVNHIVAHPESLFEAISRVFFGGQLFVGLLATMVLFMLLPTINLVNINVSRIRERMSEIGIRRAFGASSLDLVTQFLMENLVLTLAGGTIGWLGSILILDWLSTSGLIPYAHFEMNYRIFLAGLAIAVFFGFLSGVYPAWKMSRLHPVDALRGGKAA